MEPCIHCVRAVMEAHKGISKEDAVVLADPNVRAGFPPGTLICGCPHRPMLYSRNGQPAVYDG
jgi:hypothetical protein